MRLKFTSLLLTLLVAFAMGCIGAGSAFAMSPSAFVAPGTYACEAATVANEVPAPPPIWEHSGKAPSAEEVAAANATKPLCPAGQVPSRITTSGVAAPDPMPTHASSAAGEIGAASDLGAAGEPSVTPPCTGANGGCGCKKGGCYWYAYNEVEKTAIGMEYATDISEPHVSSFSYAHSIDQLALGAGTDGNQYTIETGWDVDPGLWESSPKPHFFILVNPDKYGSESCYDCDFIPASEAKITPGAILEPSTSKFRLGVEYLSTCFPGATSGCWWISAANQWIGYVPASAWGEHFTHGTTEANYGEVFDNEETPTTQMGDGQYGGSSGATWMTQSVLFLNKTEYEGTGYHGEVTNKEFYSIGKINSEKTEWHFGGPGKDPVPLVTTEGSAVDPPSHVELKGSVDPNNLETHYYFEYGPTTSYGSVSSTEPAGSGVEPVSVNATITGLKPGTTYHYRLVAYNADGYGYGADSTFATPWWFIQPTQNPHGLAEDDWFRGVSCWSASGCDAVGSNTNSADEVIGLVENWNGTSWEVQSTPKGTGAKEDNLESVSCRSASECEATGYAEVTGGAHDTLAERWNGTSWSVQTTPTEGNDSDLVSVSCASTSECVAGGSYLPSTGKKAALTELWNGKEWKTEATATLPAEDKNPRFESVSCPASKDCIAVGSVVTTVYGLIPLIESWNGSKWTLQTPATLEHAVEVELFGISCSAANACTAVGEYNPTTEKGRRALIERYNGTSWQLQEAASPVGKPAPEGSHWTLNTVSCPTSSSCVAAGSYAESASGAKRLLGEEWNGSRWELALPVDRTTGLYDEARGVSCSAALTCTLAGFTQKENNDTETLAERMWEQ